MKYANCVEEIIPEESDLESSSKSNQKYWDDSIWLEELIGFI